VSAEDHDGIWMPGRAERRADAGVAANARLTASNAVVLLARSRSPSRPGRSLGPGPV